MSTAIRVVPPVPPEVTAIAKVCQDLAVENNLERFELAVKSRIDQGIKDDNDLRLADDMLHAVVLAADALEEATKPTVSELWAKHKAAVAEVKKWVFLNDKTKKWEGRWGVLRQGLTNLILKYKAEKEELARRQQAEIDRQAEEERRRLAAEAQQAMRAGDVAKAQAIIQESQAVVAPVIMNATPVCESSQDRKPWEVTITDDMEVLKGIVAGTIPLSVLRKDAFDIAFLKKEAARRGGLNWPGMTAKQVSALSVRR